MATNAPISFNDKLQLILMGTPLVLQVFGQILCLVMLDASHAWETTNGNTKFHDCDITVVDRPTD